VARYLGFKVTHERMDLDGVVTSFFATDMQKQARTHEGVRSDYIFDHVVHLVRHPLPWIRSAHQHLGAAYWQNIQKITGIKVLFGDDRRCQNAYEALGRHWLVWNALIALQNPDLTIRLEHLKDEWSGFLDQLGCALDTPFPSIIQPIGHEPKKLEKTPVVTWDMLGDAESEVRTVASRYGYEVA
jgi:hypothetical protein